jgi:hypothetical protein
MNDFSSISRNELESELREYVELLTRAIKNAQEGDCPKIEAYFRAERAAASGFLAYLRVRYEPETCEAVNVSAVAQNVAQAAKAPRCAHFKAIKRAYAIAAKAGLNVKADEAMRAAFSRFLCKPVASRETLSGSDWSACADAVKCGYLTW